jgi:hypothetical protein
MAEQYEASLLCKIRDSPYALSDAERAKLTSEVGGLRSYAANISHLLNTGFNGRFDQVITIDPADLKTIQDATEKFRLSAKSSHIDVVGALNCIGGTL